MCKGRVCFPSVLSLLCYHLANKVTNPKEGSARTTAGTPEQRRTSPILVEAGLLLPYLSKRPAEESISAQLWHGLTRAAG